MQIIETRTQWFHEDYMDNLVFYAETLGQMDISYQRKNVLFLAKQSITVRGEMVEGEHMWLGQIRIEIYRKVTS